MAAGCCCCCCWWLALLERNLHFYSNTHTHSCTQTVALRLTSSNPRPERQSVALFDAVCSALALCKFVRLSVALFVCASRPSAEEATLLAFAASEASFAELAQRRTRKGPEGKAHQEAGAPRSQLAPCEPQSHCNGTHEHRHTQNRTEQNRHSQKQHTKRNQIHTQTHTDTHTQATKQPRLWAGQPRQKG